LTVFEEKKISEISSRSEKRDIFTIMKNSEFQKKIFRKEIFDEKETYHLALMPLFFKKKVLE